MTHHILQTSCLVLRTEVIISLKPDSFFTMTSGVSVAMKLWSQYLRCIAGNLPVYSSGNWTTSCNVFPVVFLSCALYVSAQNCPTKGFLLKTIHGAAFGSLPLFCSSFLPMSHLDRFLTRLLQGSVVASMRLSLALWSCPVLGSLGVPPLSLSLSGQHTNGSVTLPRSWEHTCPPDVAFQMPIQGAMSALFPISEPSVSEAQWPASVMGTKQEVLFNSLAMSYRVSSHL